MEWLCYFSVNIGEFENDTILHYTLECYADVWDRATHGALHGAYRLNVASCSFQQPSVQQPNEPERVAARMVRTSEARGMQATKHTYRLYSRLYFVFVYIV